MPTPSKHSSKAIQQKSEISLSLLGREKLGVERIYLTYSWTFTVSPQLIQHR